MAEVGTVYGACRGQITELVRDLARRTADHVRAYLWDGDPEPYVALFTADGPAAPLPT